MKITPYFKEIYLIADKRIDGQLWSTYQLIKPRNGSNVASIAEYREAKAKFKLNCEKIFEKIRAEMAKGTPVEKIKHIVNKLEDWTND